MKISSQVYICKGFNCNRQIFNEATIEKENKRKPVALQAPKLTTVTRGNQSNLSLRTISVFLQSTKSLELNRQQILTEYTRIN